jgi:predicted lipid-binding transport protein (Tim44 family)
MKKWSLLVLTLMAATTFLAAEIADAKRLGGGRSLGTQRQATPAPTPPAASPAAPTAPTQAMAPKPGQPAPAASGASRWLGPLAGLAAGLGIAALLSHFGLSEGFANILLLVALGVGVMFLVRYFLSKRGGGQPVQRAAMGYAGSGAPAGSPGSFGSQTPAAPATQGFKGTIGERIEPVWGGGAAQPVAAAATGAFPPGFDAAPFVQQAKLQFIRLQAAYDKGDRRALAEVMTPEMLAEVSRDLDARDTQVPTSVVALDANVREVVVEGRQYIASVHFTGSLREDGTVMEKPFEEIWNLVKPVDGSSGWLLAGIQQLEPTA